MDSLGLGQLDNLADAIGQIGDVLVPVGLEIQEIDDFLDHFIQNGRSNIDCKSVDFFKVIKFFG